MVAIAAGDGFSTAKCLMFCRAGSGVAEGERERGKEKREGEIFFCAEKGTCLARAVFDSGVGTHV